MKESFYKKDLAFIHDAGFGGPALRWAPALLAILSAHRIRRGLVVDLGCGSGLLAERLYAAGFQVLGIDGSPAFVVMARKKVPLARFKTGSLFQTTIPQCAAVVSTGEVLNYQFDRRNTQKGLGRLFRKIYASLEPGGLFVFDLADPGQVPAGKIARGFTEGDRWAVLVEKKEDRRSHLLTRRIITFVRVGKTWRRGEELHRQRLYEREDVLRLLRMAGFHARSLPPEESKWLPAAHTAFVAQKKGVGARKQSS